jgi:hypothetical protein
MDDHPLIVILDTVYRNPIYPKEEACQAFSKVFLSIEAKTRYGRQKTLDNPRPLAYKENVILDTVYRIF